MCDKEEVYPKWYQTVTIVLSFANIVIINEAYIRENLGICYVQEEKEKCESSKLGCLVVIYYDVQLV